MNKIKNIGLALLSTTLLSAHGIETWMVPFLTTTAPTSYTTDSLALLVSKKPKLSESLQFIMDNREDLELEVAKGKGERLDTLATLYVEVSEEDQEAWKLRLQENYEKIFHPKGDVAANEYVDYMLRSLSVPVE